MNGCVFCAISRGEAPASLVADRGEVIAFMDIRPWRRGHVLVVPRAHGQRLADLPAPTVAAMFALARELVVAVRGAGLPCHDVNLIVNDGPAAGQTVPHAHAHVVPRVRGDLWRMAALVVGRVLPPAPRAQLDDDARAIAAALAAAR